MRKITVILICSLILIFCMGFVSANNITSSLECINIDDSDVNMLSINEYDSSVCSIEDEVNMESDFEENSQQELNYSGNDILESKNVCDSLVCSIEDEVVDLDKSNGVDGIFQQENNDSGEGYVIYVGHNVTSDGGNGSFNNPYNNFNMACSNVNGENKVTLKVFNGNYKIGSVLKFNTTNLNVCGIGGTVIIENEFNEGKQAFGSISSSTNFTMSNIIFNASTYNSTINALGFAPFIGGAQSGIYNNCTFYGFMRAIDGSQYNTVFNNCYFHGFNGGLFLGYYVRSVSTTFNYCSFAIKKEMPALSGIIYNNNNITFNNVWFGQNMLPAYVSPPSYNVVDAKTNRWVSYYQHSVTKYAILEISEHFLGDNHYEVVGRLMWNDSTTDGIENFNPMHVQLSSSTGILPSTAVLENGFFRVNYTSNLTKHEIFAKLDFAEFDLEFESHDVILKPNHVYYGDDQNISISLPQGANGYVNVSVNNKTYIANVTDSLFNFTIPDTLKEGSYNVDVLYIDKFNHFYGNASTQISISKVSDYKMEVITSGDVMVGENAVIVIELPSDVSGLVNISFLNKTIQYNASKTLIVNISGFNAGNNPVYVRYGGDDKYNPQSRNDVIYVDRAESDVVLLNDKFYYGESNEYIWILLMQQVLKLNFSKMIWKLEIFQ